MIISIFSLLYFPNFLFNKYQLLKHYIIICKYSDAGKHNFGVEESLGSLTIISHSTLSSSAFVNFFCMVKRTLIYHLCTLYTVHTYLNVIKMFWKETCALKVLKFVALQLDFRQCFHTFKSAILNGFNIAM